MSRCLGLRMFAWVAIATLYFSGISLCTSPLLGQSIVLGRLEFPDGLRSFADGVDSFDMMASGGPAASNDQANEVVLATPDTRYLSLGSGGLIRLSFLDNLLVNSGDESPDLFVSEASGTPEAMFVSVRATPETTLILPQALDPDFDGYYSVGSLTADLTWRGAGGGWYNVLDLDAIFPGFPAGALQFDGVQLQDDPNSGSVTGLTVGVDLDSVAAISSVAREPDLRGDVNGDGLLDSADLEYLDSARGNYAVYDFNYDKGRDSADRTYWVKNLKRTYVGDSNLDGQFDSSDLVQAFASGEYEDRMNWNSTWGEGDWNFDREFNSADLVAAFQDGGFELGPRPSISAVPEAGGILAACFAFLGCMVFRRRDPRSVLQRHE